MITVVLPGFLTTVQDWGRFGWAHVGVSASGPADRLSFRIGNLLAGNPDHTPALEMTLVGGTFNVEKPCRVVITGSDFGPTVNGREAPQWEPIDLSAGDRLVFGQSHSGARCYLCLQGGIDVPRLFGSASTHLQSHLGGLEGRALRAGDRLQVGNPPATSRQRHSAVRPEQIHSWFPNTPLRMTTGPQTEEFEEAGISTLTSASYEVLEESNRMGLRLSGTPLEVHDAGEMITEGVSLGAIQVPPGGQPIILFVEHQTTGGYPKIGNVITADLHRVGQLRPRDQVRFTTVSFDEARSALRKREGELQLLKGVE